MTDLSIGDLLTHIRAELTQAFEQLDAWFAAPAVFDTSGLPMAVGR